MKVSWKNKLTTQFPKQITRPNFNLSFLIWSICCLSKCFMYSLPYEFFINSIHNLYRPPCNYPIIPLFAYTGFSGDEVIAGSLTDGLSFLILPISETYAEWSKWFILSLISLSSWSFSYLSLISLLKIYTSYSSSWAPKLAL